jgi:hypothetical protein
VECPNVYTDEFINQLEEMHDPPEQPAVTRETGRPPTAEIMDGNTNLPNDWMPRWRAYIDEAEPIEANITGLREELTADRERRLREHIEGEREGP